METNQNPAQEQPAQLILPESAQQPSSKPQPQSEQSTTKLYNPTEASQIVEHLIEFLDPEYILLFGKLVGGTPHSDTVSYDLLTVVRGTPACDWVTIKRMLRCRIPVNRRDVSYINVYIVPLNEVESHKTPFLYFAHSEGELLYCNAHHHFRRSKHSLNFATAHADAKLYYDTFHAQGRELLALAREALTKPRSEHLAALFIAQAAVNFYHTLYYVYHGQVFESHDPVLMHERMRTLSTKLMLAQDDNHIANTSTLPSLKMFLAKAHFDLSLEVNPARLLCHLERVAELGQIIAQRCHARLDLYKERCER